LNGGKPASIINMIPAQGKWYIQDANGKIYVMDKENDIYRDIMSFHKDAIKDLVVSPSHNYALTLGEDGMLKVWDYANKVA
jgi:WD40 repeat protein